MKHTWNMHTKILLTFGSIILFALLVQTVLFWRSSSEIIYQQTKEENINSLKNMQDDIYTYIKKIENSLVGIYNEKDYLNDLKSNKSAKQLRDVYFREAYHLADSRFDASDGVAAIYLYNARHELISFYRRAVTPKYHFPKDIYDSPDSNNVQAVLDYVSSDNAKMLISSYYNTSRERDIIRFALKIYETSNIGKKIGYVVCDVNNNAIRSIMEKYAGNEEAGIWIQPDGDRPMLQMGQLDPANKEACENLQEKIAAKENLLETSAVSNTSVFFQVGQSKYNLGAYALMPQSLLRKNQRILAANFVCIAVLMLFLASFATGMLSKSLTGPLERMAQTAKKIRDGNTKLRITGMKDDEVGELARNFNEMLDQIESLISSSYETRLMLNRAEYNALQAQINPHFLYNTLDTMSSIADIQGCPQVNALCQSLSNIFRYSLDFKHPFSSIAKEIAHLKNYIYVMDVRMHNHIQYEFDIADEALKSSIPRLSIQPVVENALNHGLRNIRGEKKVIICAKIKDNHLEITVQDNGTGMTTEKIEALLQHTSESEAAKRDSIGLSNIHMRMKMLYGKPYGITISSQPQCGTKVTLHLPKTTVEEMEQLWAKDLKC